MSITINRIDDLIAELTHIQDLIADGCSADAKEELWSQSGTVATIHALMEEGE